MDGKTYRQMNRQRNGWKDIQTDREKHRKAKSHLNAHTDEWTDN
jgi:hypothetical protein